MRVVHEFHGMTEQGPDLFTFSLVVDCRSHLLGQEVQSLAAEGPDVDCFFHYLNMRRIKLVKPGPGFRLGTGSCGAGAGFDCDWRLRWGRKAFDKGLMA